MTASRSTGFSRQHLTQFTLDNQIEAHVTTGPVQHTLLAGLDYAHYDFNYRFGFGTAPDLNLVTRNYGLQPIFAAPLGPRTAQSQDQVGLYLQEQAKFDRFVLTLSGRYDWVFQNTVDTTGTAA